MSKQQQAVGSVGLKELVLAAVDDRKGLNAVVLDVAELTDITDSMVIVSGTSGRHVKALVSHVLETVKGAGFPVIGVEGRDRNEWVLVDLADVVVHIMRAESRNFYDLERLWEGHLKHSLEPATGANAASTAAVSATSASAGAAACS